MEVNKISWSHEAQCIMKIIVHVKVQRELLWVLYEDTTRVLLTNQEAGDHLTLNQLTLCSWPSHSPELWEAMPAAQATWSMVLCYGSPSSEKHAHDLHLDSPILSMHKHTPHFFRTVWKKVVGFMILRAKKRSTCLPKSKNLLLTGLGMNRGGNLFFPVKGHFNI